MTSAPAQRMRTGSAAGGAPFDSRFIPDAAYGSRGKGLWRADSTETTVAGSMHLLTALVLGALAPVIMYYAYGRRASPFVREHCRQSLNLVITVALAAVTYVFVVGMVVAALAEATDGRAALLLLPSLLFVLYWTVAEIAAAAAGFTGTVLRLRPAIPFFR